MCPVSWSAEIGAGMGPPERGVGGVAFGVGCWRSGVDICSVGAGEEFVSGVAACSVANRSGVGVEAGRLHPARARKMRNVRKSPDLLVIQFDRFKVELLTSQNFCAITSAIWTVNFLVEGMILLKTSHALHLCFYKTEVKSRVFRKCTFAKLVPTLLNGCIADLCDFPKNQIHILYGM